MLDRQSVMEGSRSSERTYLSPYFFNVFKDSLIFKCLNLHFPACADQEIMFAASLRSFQDALTHVYADKCVPDPLKLIQDGENNPAGVQALSQEVLLLSEQGQQTGAGDAGLAPAEPHLLLNALRFLPAATLCSPGPSATVTMCPGLSGGRRQKHVCLADATRRDAVPGEIWRPSAC